LIGILVLNGLAIAVAAVIAAQILPSRMYTDALTILHNTIGISPPTEQNARMVALLWIGSLLLITDVLLFMLVFLTHMMR